MAYESSIPFADIRDFREAEINGIPALFTMSRLDSETLPADFHSCEVMGGRGSDFQWLVPLALANFTGTFVSRQPLLREGQAYAEIRRYGIMTRRQSTNGLKTTTITLKHYATKIQTEGLLYLPRNNRITVSFNTPIADNYSHVYPLLIHESNASVLKQLYEAGFSMSMTKKGLEVSKY